MWVHTRQRPPTSQPPRKPRALVSLTCPVGQLPRLSHPAASHAAALGKTLALSWSLLNHRELCHRQQVLGLARRCHFTPMWTSLRLHDSVHLGGEPDQSSWACCQHPASLSPQGIIQSDLMGLKHSVSQSAVQNPGYRLCSVL